MFSDFGLNPLALKPDESVARSNVGGHSLQAPVTDAHIHPIAVILSSSGFVTFPSVSIRSRLRGRLGQTDLAGLICDIQKLLGLCLSVSCPL